MHFLVLVVQRDENSDMQTLFLCCSLPSYGCKSEEAFRCQVPVVWRKWIIHLLDVVKKSSASSIITFHLSTHEVRHAEVDLLPLSNPIQRTPVYVVHRQLLSYVAWTRLTNTNTTHW